MSNEVEWRRLTVVAWGANTRGRCHTTWHKSRARDTSPGLPRHCSYSTVRVWGLVFVFNLPHVVHHVPCLHFKTVRSSSGVCRQRVNIRINWQYFRQLNILWEMEEDKKCNLECHELTDYHYYTNVVFYKDYQPWKKLELHSVKLRYFLRVFNIANQLLTSHSPFMPHCQVDEWTYNKLFMWNFSSRVQCEWYLTCEKLSRTLEKKFHIYVGLCIILYSFIVFSMINLLNSSQWMY